MADQVGPFRYVFDQLGLSFTITVLPVTRHAGYPAYPVTGGSGSFTPPSGGQPVHFSIPPTQYLWATSAGGDGGNSYGIDPTGLNLQGGLGWIAWNGKQPTAFAFGMSGFGAHDVTLKSSTYKPTP